MYDDYLFDLVLERQPTEQDRFGNSYSCRLKLHIVSLLQFFFLFKRVTKYFVVMYTRVLIIRLTGQLLTSLAPNIEN